MMFRIIKINQGLWMFLLVSFACHLLFLNIFTFHFSEKEISVKPFLFSLGTIIPKSDFLELRKTVHSFEPDFEKIRSDGRSNLGQLIKVSKPLGGTTTKKAKSALKSTFPVSVEDDNADDRMNDVNENGSFYEPLRLP
jgi:hypothetical protein